MPYIIVIAVLIIAGAAFAFYQNSTSSMVAVDEARVEEINTEPAVATEELPNEIEALASTEGETTEIVTQSNTITLTSGASEYADGSYTTQTSYFTPKRVEHDLDITLVITDDIVTDAVVLYDGAAPETPIHQGFDNAYRAAVVGQPLSEISLSRVGGASLTTEAFNEAIVSIQAEASA